MPRLIALVLCLTLAAAAQAHTPLKSSAPAADAAVAAPKAIELTFGGDVRLTSATLTDAGGAAKHLDAVPTAVASTFSLGVHEPLAPGVVQGRLARRRRRHAHHLGRVRVHGGCRRRRAERLARVLRHRCARHRPSGDRLRRIVPGRRRRAVSRALRAVRRARVGGAAAHSSRVSRRSSRSSRPCCTTC